MESQIFNPFLFLKEVSFSKGVTSSYARFEEVYGLVKDLEQSLKKDKISDNQPDKDSDPVPNTISTTLSGIIGGGLKIAGAVGSTIKGLFTSGVSKVKGWWQGLKDKVDENKPTDADSSSALTTLGTNLGIIVGKVDVEEILGSIFNDFCIGK